MMIVKVIFAEMNHAYDFKVDETQKVKQVATEMAEMIAEKEHLNLSKIRECSFCASRTDRAFFCRKVRWLIIRFLMEIPCFLYREIPFIAISLPLIGFLNEKNFLC